MYTLATMFYTGTYCKNNKDKNILLVLILNC
jgi:hypothetical protein